MTHRNDVIRYPELTLALEQEVLSYALDKGVLEYAELAAGESLLILPRAGHAVLTGDFKVVLAGEWHWQGEADDLSQVKYNPQPTPSELVKKKQAQKTEQQQAEQKQRGKLALKARQEARAGSRGEGSVRHNLSAPASTPTRKLMSTSGRVIKQKYP